MAKFKKTELTVWQAKHNSEKRRTEVGSVRVGFIVRLFLNVHLFQEWTPITELYRGQNPSGTKARRIRRVMRDFAAQGFIEIRDRQDGYYEGGPRYLEFRSLVTC